ncbi:MAG: ABC transporter substrate-binding protein [Meiothermus sp.]|uniref:ABC transporter substrate-binding protein n=1 Tax=Meiothermus sp. TaxID=1955249 RepID=UPI0025F4595C|nr:ABC transporter substrate-binding protein [Meiothermus sp.]MCS7057683.1 ABC transporter substrate-binding protein [Meiothermus sp.]MCS7193452.1 ABC transporter substrate-binding protein [Meiothermus sp.]MCX7740532.1 ABC transporter substrate-binding protein [Meiothermus sp.]MDW8091344.1 ABC transporter substrate-binding protein [Meiothermus sp.]MDW8482410.1 ABC transporter substrate-binding protein [Meiothermus sp.]
MRAWIGFLVVLGVALAQRPVEIPFWHTAGPPGQEPLEEMIREFNARQREYRIVPSFVGDYREGGLKLLAALRSGGAPVLFHAELSFLGRMAQDNVALPLDEYLGGIPNDFYPGFLEAGRFRGRTYGLPIGLSVPVFFYNADQFAARGLNPPRTWEEVAQAAQQLTTRAAKGYTLSSDIYSFNVLVMSRGGRIVDAQGRPDFTNPKVVESLEFLQDMVRRNIAQSRNIAEAQFSVADFLRTKTFMGVAPITMWPLIESRAPIPFRLGVGAVPRAEGGKVPLAGGTLVVLRGASEPQVRGAVAFWRYLMEPANIARWVRATYYMPMRRAAQAQLEDFYREDPRRRVAFAQVEHADIWLQDPEFTIWYSYLEDALERALKGNANARQVLEEAQRRALAVERR